MCGGTTAAHRPHLARENVFAEVPKDMDRVWTTDLASHAGEQVLVRGWLHHYRQLSTVSFLLLRDARGLAQLVVEAGPLAARLAALKHETVIEVSGAVRTQPQAPGGIEIVPADVRVLAEPAEEPPLDLYRPALRAQLPAILDLAPLTLRHPGRRAMARLADASVEGFRQILRAKGFVEIHTPKLVGSATEGGANVFPVDYFGRPAYLAQSPQLYKQVMVGVLERVYEVGPVFRAEPHDSTRHLNEYTSLDLEMGFIEDHREVMAVLRDVLAAMVAAIAEAPWADSVLRLLAFRLPEVPATIP
jgi:nondiscriminating aspartyl-tRNA synthetase